MKHDLNKIAVEVQRAHIEGRGMRLPAMTVRDLGILAGLLQSADAHASALVH